MKPNFKYYIFIFLQLAFLGFSCNNCQEIYKYHAPQLLDDGLEVGSLAQVNMDTQILSRAIDCIYEKKYDQIHAFLLYKDGMLVLEEYFSGNKYQWDGENYHGERIQWDRDSLHVIMSCTKSITSACIGIAINQGYIKDVHESIFNYLPDHQQYKKEGKEAITIEHLLTMTSGLVWDEWHGAHGTVANDIDRIYIEYQSDPISGVLGKPLAHPPGEEFTYNGGGMIILGEILKNASQKNIGEFAKENLFSPLGIDSVWWYQFENGTFACDGSIKMTPRDMVKFGVTYLNEGSWKNQRIVSKEWVEQSKKPYRNNVGINVPIDDSGKNGYAYSWWTNEISIAGSKKALFQAAGWGGQEIIVIPDDQLVVVFTGGNYVVKKKLYRLIKKYILPSIH